MKFAALGRTKWLYDSIQACVGKGHEIVLIGTAPAAPEYDVRESDFLYLANQYKCPSFCDIDINKPAYIQMARNSKAKAAISVNWPTMIRCGMLDTFRSGVINAHAGDLPRFRGNACPNWAILAGEDKIVLTLHRMTEDLDAGPILLQRHFPLTHQTYIGDVYDFMAQNVPDMFVEVLDKLENGSLESRPQPPDPKLSLRCFPRLPCDGRIDWAKPAEEIACLVRASAEPFAGAFSTLEDEKITIWRAHADELGYPYLGVPGHVAEIRKQTGEVAIIAGQGILVLEEVETGSSGRLKAAHVIQSLRTRLGRQ